MKYSLIIANLFLGISSFVLNDITNYGLNCSQKQIEKRNVQYWVANPDKLINTKTNSCSVEFMNNISNYIDSIDSFGPYLWKTTVINSSAAAVVYESNSAVKCYNEVKDKYSDISIGASGGISECWNNNCNAKVIGRNPEFFINSLIKYMATAPIIIDEVWIDFETKQLNRNDTKNLNRLFDLLSDRVTLYRYAGCVHNHEPAYLNETCEQFTNVAPKVKVQGAGTYWDNTVSGFNAILLDMVSDIGVLNVDKLSVAVCPSCAPYDQITQEELYERMDLICRLNITSISAFTIDEILERYGVNNTGGRWMEAFRYFRTGEKK